MIDITNIRWSVLLVLTVLFCTGCRTLPSHTPSAREPDDLRIHFFNVGVGAMALVECPADSLGRPSRPILIDGGSVSENTTFSPPISYGLGVLGHHPNKEKTRRKLKQILNGRNIDLIITHPHVDHANWISGLLDGVHVEHILLGGALEDYQWPMDIRKWIMEKGYLPITYFGMKSGWHNGGKPLGDNAEDKIKGFGCGAAEVYVLTVNSPEVDLYPEKSLPNLQSAVILIQYTDFRALFPGDAEGSTEKTALANLKYFKHLALDDSTSLPLTVLAVAHHGTDTAHSNHPAWVEATKPKVVVYSAGTWYGHPRCNTTKRYRNNGLFEFDQEHLFQCGIIGTVASLSLFTKGYSKHAEFVTHLNGDVVITTKGRSHLHLEYGLSQRREEIVRY